MPHLTVEYTNNLDGFFPSEALLILNKSLLNSGQFEEIDIKSRAIGMDYFSIGVGLPSQGFIHAKLAILSGRSAEQKSTLSNGLLQALQNFCVKQMNCKVQLCVEVLDIDRESYAKTTLG